MSDDIYDDPDLKPDTDFVKFDAVGDGIDGVVLAVGKHTFDDGKSAIKLLIREDGTGDERTLTAGQVQLKAKLADVRPRVADHVSIRMTEIEKRSGGKTLKHFEVKVGEAKPVESVV